MTIDADARGDNADEIIRLRDALADAEYQSARWVADAAKWEREADRLKARGDRYRAALVEIAKLGSAYPGSPSTQIAAAKAREALGDQS